MAIVTLGIDLAKNVFAVHGVDATGKPVLVRAERRWPLFHRVMCKRRWCEGWTCAGCACSTPGGDPVVLG
jgi:hypothetical protein